jgi:hypothetical protein
MVVFVHEACISEHFFTRFVCQQNYHHLVFQLLVVKQFFVSFVGVDLISLCTACLLLKYLLPRPSGSVIYSIFATLNTPPATSINSNSLQPPKQQKHKTSVYLSAIPSLTPFISCVVTQLHYGWQRSTWRVPASIF